MTQGWWRLTSSSVAQEECHKGGMREDQEMRRKITQILNCQLIGLICRINIQIGIKLSIYSPNVCKSGCPREARLLWLPFLLHCLSPSLISSQAHSVASWWRKILRKCHFDKETASRWFLINCRTDVSSLGLPAPSVLCPSSVCPSVRTSVLFWLWLIIISAIKRDDPHFNQMMKLRSTREMMKELVSVARWSKVRRRGNKFPLFTLLFSSPRRGALLPDQGYSGTAYVIIRVTLLVLFMSCACVNGCCNFHLQYQNLPST